MARISTAPTSSTPGAGPFSPAAAVALGGALAVLVLVALFVVLGLGRPVAAPIVDGSSPVVSSSAPAGRAPIPPALLEQTGPGAPTPYAEGVSSRA